MHLQINVCCFAAVEPTYSYYEKVSEELEKIVHEVKEKEEVRPLSDGKRQFLFVLIMPLLKCETVNLHSSVKTIKNGK